MKTNRRGFTLVELNLSVVFVALLILGIAMTTIQVTRMYQKGATIRSVNQVGRDLTEQLRRDFAAASPSAVNLDEVSVGRICLGNVSYLYNDAVTLNDGAEGIKNPSGDKVVLARVNDRSGSYCQRDSAPGGGFIKPNLEAGDDATELLATDVIPLAVHEITADTYLASDSNGISQTVYRLAITVGTNEVETVDETTSTCRPPTESTANFDNCFVSEFETIVRAGEITR